MVPRPVAVAVKVTVSPVQGALLLEEMEALTGVEAATVAFNAMVSPLPSVTVTEWLPAQRPVAV